MFNVGIIYEIAMKSFIYSFNKYLLNIYSVLEDTRDIVTKKQNRFPTSESFYFREASQTKSKYSHHCSE